MLDNIKKYNDFENLDIGFPRKKYLESIKESINTSNLIKVIIGQRRVGKSFILKQVINYLIKEQNVEKSNILYLNFEYEEIFTKISSKEKLSKIITEYFKDTEKKKYLFLDEIQEVNGWEKLINSLRADHTIDIEIFITGSNSKLLSGELATYLAGRYIEFQIYPFSFEEYLQYTQKQSSKTSLLEYINFSGLPELYNLPNRELQYSFLKSLKDTVILKDIVKRYSIKNVDLLEKVFLFLVNNIGNSLSLDRIRKKLLQEGIKITTVSLGNYVKYFEDIFILKGVSRYDLHGKRILEGEKKYYLNDLGFLNFFFSSFESFISKKLENYVYNFFASNGYNISVGKLKNLEIDFLMEKNGRKIYIQVAYLLASKEIIDREYGNLRKIKDSFEKYVVSMDDIEFKVDDIGIRHLQIWRLEEIIKLQF